MYYSCQQVADQAAYSHIHVIGRAITIPFTEVVELISYKETHDENQ